MTVGLFAAAYAVGRRVWPDRGPGGQDGQGARESDDPSDSLERDTEFVGDEPSDEAIAERSEPEVEVEPAEPGEMTVDDEVVEDIVDEDAVHGEDEG